MFESVLSAGVKAARKMGIFRNFVLVASAFLAVFFSAGEVAHSKDLSSRLGIGFRRAFPFDLAAVSAQYFTGPDLGLSASIGVDTLENNSKFGLQLGIRRIVFKEDRMNFFMGGTVSMLTQEVSATKYSGYELAAIIGSEFFMAGLDNLGFNVETGVAVTSLDKVRFRTLGDDFLRAGIYFYF